MIIQGILKILLWIFGTGRVWNLVTQITVVWDNVNGVPGIHKLGVNHSFGVPMEKLKNQNPSTLWRERTKRR